MYNPMLNRLPQNSAAAGTTTTTSATNFGPMSQIRQAMEYVRSNGGDARTAFYKLAKQKGVDPESVLRSLR